MKYILTTSLLGLVLVGCADNQQSTDPHPADQAQTHPQPTVFAPHNASNTTSSTASSDTTHAMEHNNAQADQEIHFTGPNDLMLTLTTTDHFETAELSDGSNQRYQLKRVVSGSGVRLANEAGVSIHFKNFDGVNEGTVELVKDKPIEIKELKQ